MPRKNIKVGRHLGRVFDGGGGAPTADRDRGRASNASFFDPLGGGGFLCLKLPSREM